jgi:branched-subunit amino acid ABC-type transport system permease component/ABC-type branched-subunit amino acid transport system ATPase component
MVEFWNLVVGGAVAGGLYAILASGIVLTYQTSGIFNFAHGAIAFATAFLFFQLNTGLGWPVWLAAIAAIVVFAPLLGWGLDRIVFRRLASAPATVKLVVPIALLVAIPALCLYVVDRINAWFDAGLPRQDQILAIRGLGPMPKRTWRVGDVLIDTNQIAVFVAALVAAAALWLVLRHTRLGLRMRAVVDRRDLAQTRGIDADRTSSVSWMIGSLLAGVAGVLLAPLFTLNPPTFTTVVLISTPAVVLARFRSLPIAFVGGLLIGVVQNLIAGYADIAREITGFRTAVPFILLFLLLFAFGDDRSRRAGLAATDAPPAALGATSVRRKALVWGFWVAVLLVYAFVFADSYWQALIARGLALGLVLLSFTIVTGIGGMVSLAQAAFVTAAAFTAGWALSHDWPFVAALAAGSLVAAALGIVVSLPARRLGGLPLALSTMALAFIAQYLFFQLDAFSNQDSSGWAVQPPEIGPLDFGDNRTMIVGLLVLLATAAWVVGNLTRSASGRAITALRSTEPGAVTVGVLAARTKVAVFALSAAVAGFGGVLLVSTIGRVSNTDFPVEIGFFWLTSAVVFGIRRPAGAVLAGVSGALSPEVFGWIDGGSLLPQVMFGLAAVQLAQNPDGILAIVAAQRHEREQKRAAKRAARDAAGAPAPVLVSGSSPPASRSDRVGGDGGDAGEPPVLRLGSLRAGYGDVEVLRSVDLSIPRGETLALVGANGAGKSTLCAVVAGLVTPTGGTIELDGADVTAQPPFGRVEAGAFLIPEGRGIFPALSVDENLEIWLPDPDQRDAAYDRFPALAGRRQQAAGALSGGEQQMLALAPALVRPPVLLVADEPSLGLAPLVVDEVYAALRELKDRGTTMLLVEEKAKDVLGLADTVAFLDAGNLAFVAPAADVDEERLVQAYLGLGTRPVPHVETAPEPASP